MTASFVALVSSTSARSAYRPMPATAGTPALRSSGFAGCTSLVTAWADSGWVLKSWVARHSPLRTYSRTRTCRRRTWSCLSCLGSSLAARGSACCNWDRQTELAAGCVPLTISSISRPEREARQTQLRRFLSPLATHQTRPVSRDPSAWNEAGASVYSAQAGHQRPD